MAESLMDIERLPANEGKSHQNQEEISRDSIVADADSGDGEDYSSGSDRSLEADDVEYARRDSFSVNSQSNNNVDSQEGRSRRKRRHGSHGSRRHKGGSRHKHKGFHPYPPKNEMKRKSLEIKEKENAAAELRREDGDQEFVKFPSAPFNSTQFLMDEHSLASPATSTSLTKTPSSSKLDNTTFILSSVPSTPLETNADTANWDKQESQKVNKEFVEIYTTVHAESLQSLPKEELVKHYMNLEEQVAVLQKKVAEQSKKGEESSKLETDVDKDSVDTASVSDTNSLSSSNEEFVDLSLVNQPTITVGGDVIVQKQHTVVQMVKDNVSEILS